MKNIYKRHEWNKKDEIYQSDGYCPSIQNVPSLHKYIQALFIKQHKLQQLLAQNQLKKLGLQTAQALIKALYQQMKRLQIQKYQYRSQMQEMYRQFVEREKQLQREIYRLRILESEGRCYVRRQLQQQQEQQQYEQYSNISQENEHKNSQGISPILPQSYTPNMSKQFGRCGGRVGSPIKKMGVMETVSKQYMQDDNSKKYQMRRVDCDNNNDYDYDNSYKEYRQTINMLLAQELDRMVVDYQYVVEMVRVQRDQLNIYQQQHVENQLRVKQELIDNNNKHNTTTTSTKPNYSSTNQYTQHYRSTENKYDNLYTNNNDDGNNNNKRLPIIQGKRLFSTENYNIQTSPQYENMNFSSFIIGNGDNKNKSNQLTKNTNIDNSNSKSKNIDKNNSKNNSKDKDKDQLSYGQIITQYQLIIQHYKQYSAYLKAYLCSCIGFIAKQNQSQTNQSYCQTYNNNNNSNKTNKSPQTNKYHYKNSNNSDLPSTQRSNNLIFCDFPSDKLFDIVLSGILQAVDQKIHLQNDIRKQLQKQNTQLRHILDQLIHNLKLTVVPNYTTNTVVNKDKNIYDRNQSYNNKQQYELIKNNKSIHKNNIIKSDRNSKNKYHKISINKPIGHKITLTQQDSNYYRSVK